jgi:hypothetical protein
MKIEGVRIFLIRRWTGMVRGMMNWRLVVLGIGLAWFAGERGAVGADRYVAWLRDGTRMKTKSLSAWPLPGGSFRLDNRELLETENAARFVRDQDAASSLKAPYLVMANGDIVPGMITQFAADTGRAGQTTRALVELESPLVPASGAGLPVQTRHVERIVVEPRPGTPATPGTVRLLEGRQVTARAIRWRERGLAVLTAEGIVEVDFSDLAEVVFPSVDRAEAVVADNAFANGGHSAAIARLMTKGGAALTAARVMREQETGRRRGRLASEVLYYVQPAWADEPLAIPEEEIVACGYRAADEAPLSCFPATTLANRRLIGQPEAWTANQNPRGGVLAAGGLESDLGIAAHSHSEVAFDLPTGAKSLQLAVGLQSREGGCVRCKIVNDQGSVVWDAGVLEGKDGVRRVKGIEIEGMKRLVLVTEYAHEERPVGADPLDIRDAVAWLSPLIKLDASVADPRVRVRTMLAGAGEWQQSGEAWSKARLSSQWNLLASTWYPAIAVSRGDVLSLTRTMRVTRENDVVELLTVCPADLEEHDLQLTVNGTAVPWHNNADRNQLRQWTARYSKQRARDGNAEESNLSDRLAYWWDLQAWRGQEVTLQLDLAGKRDTNEIVCRSLAVRPAIGNLKAGEEPRRPEVPLAKVPMDGDAAFLQPGSARLLGQEFSQGYTLARNGNARWAIAPEFKSFVAVVGCTNQVAGPLQIVVDDRVMWERATINSLSPAEQVVVELPAGAKTLMLRCGAEAPFYGTAALVEAGFTVK